MARNLSDPQILQRGLIRINGEIEYVRQDRLPIISWVGAWIYPLLGIKGGNCRCCYSRYRDWRPALENIAHTEEIQTLSLKYFSSAYTMVIK